MGTVNKQSVREEVERIKSEFDRLSAGNKINNETKMLFQSMFMIINLILSVFLEKKPLKTIGTQTNHSPRFIKMKPRLQNRESIPKEKMKLTIR